MRLARIGVLTYLFLALSICGCGLKKAAAPESSKMEQAIVKTTPQMIEEYAMIYQMSDLKTAEYYLTHPDYARENPYKPTEEDMAFYESKFLEVISPRFKRLVEQEGAVRARHRLMKGASRRMGGGTGEPSSVDSKAWIIADRLAKKNELILNMSTKSMKMYGEGRIDDAIKYMRITLEASPESPTLQYDMGVMLMKTRNYQEAVGCFQNSIKILKATGYTNLNIRIHPKVYMGSCINMALIYKEIGMYDEAVEVLKEAIEFGPDDLDANWNLGVVYWSMGDVEKAAPQMRRCIGLDPDNDEAHNTVGLLYYREKFYNAALNEFQIAAKLYPNNKQYHYNVGVVMAKLGRYDEASYAFRRAVGLMDAEELHRIFAEQPPENKARKLYNDGCHAMENRNISGAIKSFKAALEIKPEMLRAHVNLGLCYGKRRDREEQIHHLEKAVRLNPKLATVRYNLGLAYSDVRMYHRAISEFRKAAKFNPSSRDAHFNFGIALCKTGRYTDAIPKFERCLELSPNWFAAHINLGTCYLRAGNIEGAVKHFKEAAKLRPNSAEAHYNLGAACMKAEKFDEASVLFQKTLKLDPRYRQARIMLKDLEIRGVKQNRT